MHKFSRFKANIFWEKNKNRHHVCLQLSILSCGMLVSNKGQMEPKGGQWGKTGSHGVMHGQMGLKRSIPGLNKGQSHTSKVQYSRSPMLPKYHAPKVPCSKSPMLPKSHALKVTWCHIPKFPCSQKPMLQKVHAPKVPYS